MLKRAILFGLLMLPGSFLVLGVACVHPRVRGEILRLCDPAGRIHRLGLAYAVARARRLR